MPKNIVKRAAEFCALPKFERVFDDFARDIADAFLDAVEAKGGEVEHKHEYKQLHDKYLQLFETELSDFVESEGSTIEEFFSECREIFEGQYTVLFDEHQYAWFVEHLLACMDYKHFYGLMVNEARRQSRNLVTSQLPPNSARNPKMSGTTGDVRVFVWGSGGAGQLGLGNSDDLALPQELPIHTYEIVAKSIVTGGCHSAGLDLEGVLYMWGDNEKLQLGRPRDVPSLQAPKQSALTSSTAQCDKVHLIACGWSHTVAVTTNASDGDGEKPVHQVWSWGAHDHHQLGRDVTAAFPASAPHPLPFSALTTSRRVISVACGWKHSLLVLDDGSVFSWGAGRHGELGLGREALTAPTPTLVASLDGYHIDSVYCGWQHSTFHSSSTGAVFACGNNRHGQLGVPKITEPSRFQPAQVLMSSGLREPLQVSQVSVGWHFTLSLDKDGKLYSWGKGAHGQLGQGSYENAESPISVQFDETVSAIACGSEHSMVVTQSGELFTSGWGEHGNLGHGDTDNRSRLTKVAFFVDQNLHVESVAAGGAVSIALVRSQAS